MRRSAFDVRKVVRCVVCATGVSTPLLYLGFHVQEHHEEAGFFLGRSIHHHHELYKQEKDAYNSHAVHTTVMLCIRRQVRHEETDVRLGEPNFRLGLN